MLLCAAPVSSWPHAGAWPGEGPLRSHTNGRTRSSSPCDIHPPAGGGHGIGPAWGRRRDAKGFICPLVHRPLSSVGGICLFSPYWLQTIVTTSFLLLVVRHLLLLAWHLLRPPGSVGWFWGAVYSIGQSRAVGEVGHQDAPCSTKRTTPADAPVRVLLFDLPRDVVLFLCDHCMLHPS